MPPESQPNVRPLEIEKGPSAPHLPDYELLRLIGRGSYGEVWLARGVTGIYRAIKIVRRASFREAGPFEREFKGLKEFASISLGESVQLALLHVGRDDAAGFFYYVMELADDVTRGRDIDPATYVPLTLAGLCEKRGRLPAADCVRFGVELARVLAGLHARKLVHRDIKPSNVILVGGVPKLADIGLVAPTSTALTFVGTEGFVPPEGPGRPAADVYALGKVLYELSTGLDRQEFPQLPAELTRLPDHALLLELNEVILRACDPVARERYSDGGAMLEDLLALQRKGSVRPRRGWRVAALAAAVVLVAAAAALFWWKPKPTPPVAPVVAVAPTPVISPHSIAVLPFENYSTDKENGFFADGVYDDILTNLATLSALRVISRTTMLQYRATTKSIRQIGAELGVAYVLEGSVRRAGNKVRVTGQLIRAATDEHVWANTYDRDLTDVFAIQSELSHEIAAALNGALTPQDESRLERRPTTSMAAYDLYQRARALERANTDERDAITQELALYEQAVQLDPNYAEAWARLSNVALGVSDDVFAPASAAQVAKARAALARAEEIDPDNFVVLMAGADFGAITQDRAMVNRRRQRIIELFPNRAEARFVAGLTAEYEGRVGEALAAYREAAALDPHNVELLGNMESILNDLRMYDEYAAVLRAHRALQPELLSLAYQQALVPLHQSGSTAELNAFLASLPPDPEHTRLDLTSFRAQALFLLGDAEGFIHLWREAGPRWRYEEGRIFDDITVAMALIVLHQPEEARPLPIRTREYCQSVVAKHPNIVPRWNLMGLSQALLGEPEARPTLEHVRKLVNTDPELKRFISGVMFYNAMWRAWAGEKPEAVAEMNRRIKEGAVTSHANVFELRTSLFAWPLRGDPAFTAMLNEPANNAPVQAGKHGSAIIP